jgi:uncharacterized protein YbjT (DUF2867 family)
MGQNIFVTGGTGYIGSRLIPLLLERGHRVTALVRPQSREKLPLVANCIVGDALKLDSYTDRVRGADTFVHLIGVPHPSPSKAKQFREIDLVSIRVAIAAARDADVGHFVYLSVAQPAPIMEAFIAVRAEGEVMISASGIPATFLRPWYVLGPGHRWPYALLPMYWLFQLLPATRKSAQRLGLVTIQQMINALVWSIEHPTTETRIIDVPQIRRLAPE